MRERLIELLGDFPIFHSTMKERWMPEAVERLADYLLSEGVIVPPCKVGDRIYYIDSTKFIDCEVIKQISINHHGKWLVLLDHSVIDFDEIGKTVFLTKETAERALRNEQEKL